MDILLILADFGNTIFFTDLADFIRTSWFSSRTLFGRPSWYFFFSPEFRTNTFPCVSCDVLRASSDFGFHEVQNCISTFVNNKWQCLSYTYMHNSFEILQLFRSMRICIIQRRNVPFHWCNSTTYLTADTISCFPHTHTHTHCFSFTFFVLEIQV